MTLLAITPQVFSIGLIIYLATMALILLIYWALVDGYFVMFFYNAGFVFGAIADFACQLWLGLRGFFMRNFFNSKFPGHQKEGEDIF